MKKGWRKPAFFVDVVFCKKGIYETFDHDLCENGALLTSVTNKVETLASSKVGERVKIAPNKKNTHNHDTPLF
ncbi:MAG: hypothetical protein PHD53_10620 [Methylococcales bacterium]|nr:hypothetical protein [Methylococcales bacterium]